jgi:hypothetical protein
MQPHTQTINKARFETISSAQVGIAAHPPKRRF